LKIGILSDIHIDYNSPLNLITESLIFVTEENSIDALIIPGDISSDYRDIDYFLNSFHNNSKVQIKFTLGNHDFWTRGKIKSEEVINYFSSYKQYLPKHPLKYKDNVFVGSSGWYDYSFGPEGFTNEQFDKMKLFNRTWPDKRFCSWSKTNQEINEKFLLELEAQISYYEGKNIIPLTHIVPNKKFIVSNTDPLWNYNNAFFGSSKYHDLYKKHKIKKAFFGHTHFCFNDIVENIEYISAPLGYRDFEWTNLNPIDEIKKKIHIMEIL